MIRGVERNNKISNNKKGFTLVELIVVLVILAILAAIAIPLMLGFTDDAREKRYITDANAALKASQTVITEVYNEGGNLLDGSKRYKAWEMAGIDKSDTWNGTCSQFKVWTGKQLMTNQTAAISDNIASYTVMYAQYQVPTEDGEKVLFYDGSEWKVFDDETALSKNTKYNEIMASYGNNVIYMWPNYVDNPTAYDDTAHGDIKVAEKEWEVRDESDPNTATVILHGFKINKHGLAFVNGDIKEDTVKVTFTRDENNVTTNNWDSEFEVLVNDKPYTITTEKGYVFLNKWAVNDADSEEKLVYGNGEDGIFNAINIERIFSKNIHDLYAKGYQDYEERKVKFHAFNLDSLWFGPENNKQQDVEVTFRRFKSTDFQTDFTYEESLEITSSEGTKVGACDWTDFKAATVNEAGGYRFAGWALNPTGVEGNYKTDADGIVEYGSIEKLWNEVFGVSEAVSNDYIFIGIMERVQIVKFCRDADKHSSFVDFTGDELEYEVETKELTGKVTDNLDGYLDHELVADNGYRHKGWSIDTTIDGHKESVKVENSLGSIRLHINAYPEEVEYVFTAIIEEGARTKFIANKNTNPLSSTGANKNDEGTFAGQIYHMTKGENNNLLTFQRVSYNSDYGIGMFDVDEYGNGTIGSSGTIVEGLDDDKIGNDKAVYCNGSHWKRYEIDSNVDGVGHVYRFYILWDGRKTADEDEPEYDIPLFAYSIRVGNQYHIRWFTRENSPELPGNFNGLFQDYPNLSFFNSDISSWDTSACTGMACMFDNTSLGNYQIDFSKLDYSSVKTMERMFDRNSTLTSIAMSGRNMKSLLTMKEMFKRCTALNDFHMLNTEAKILTNVENMFYNAKNLETVEFSGTNMQSVTSLKGFLGETSIGNGSVGNDKANIKNFYAKGWNISSVTSLEGFFSKGSFNGDYENIISGSSQTDIGYSALLRADFSGADLSSVINFNGMFKWCPYLNFVSFEGAKMCGRTDVAIPMREMFYHCFRVKNINLKIGTEIHPTDFFKMFDYCLYLENIEMETAYSTKDNRVMATKFCSERVTTMRNMFYNNGHQTEQFYRYFDYENCEITYRMFRGTVFGNERDGYTSVSFAGISMPKLTDMEEMFMQSWVDTVSFENCNLSKVTKVTNLFKDSRVREVKFDNCDLSGYTGALDTMFSNNPEFEVFTGSGMDAREVSKLNSLFNGSTLLKQVDLSDSNFSKVNSLNAMFKNCSSLTNVNISGMTLGAVTDMSEMFSGCTVLADLPMNNLKFENVTTLKQTFYNCKALKEISLNGWNLKKLSTFEQTFYGVNATTIDISNNDFEALTSLNKMFENAKIETLKLENVKMNMVSNFPNGMFTGSTVRIIKASGWELSNAGVTSMNSLFAGNTTLSEIDLTNAKFPNVSNMGAMFKNCPALTKVETAGITLGSVTNMKEMFMNCASLASVDLGGISSGSNIDMSFMFSGCTILNYSDITIDTSKASNLSNMFKGCVALAKKDGEVKCDNIEVHIDSATTIENMFNGCGYLKNVTFKGAGNDDDSSSSPLNSASNVFTGVTNIEKISIKDVKFSKLSTTDKGLGALKNMVNSCKAYLQGFEMNNVSLPANFLSTDSLFDGFTNLTSAGFVNVSAPEMIRMKQTFNGCNSLVSMDFSGFDAPKVWNFSWVFQNCSSLTSVNFGKYGEASAFKLESLTDLGGTFKGCTSLTELDLTALNTTNTFHTNETFSGCRNLEKIYVTDPDESGGYGFINSKISGTNANMFLNCTKIKGGNGTTYSSSNVNKAYAKVDKDGQVGYFSTK